MHDSVVKYEKNIKRGKVSRVTNRCVRFRMSFESLFIKMFQMLIQRIRA